MHAHLSARSARVSPECWGEAAWCGISIQALERSYITCRLEDDAISIEHNAPQHTLRVGRPA